MFCQIMVSKVLTKTQSPTSVFIDGDSGSKTTCTVMFKKGLAKGDYLITYRAEYDEFHSEKKLVVSTYNQESEVHMYMQDPQNFSFDRFSALAENLENRMS